MHKSAGNGVEPSEIIKDYGADIIRLWVASSDYTVDVRAGKNIFKQLSEAYRKIRNTARFILGNLDGFDPNTDCVADDQLQDIDRWALAALDDLIVNTNAGYAVYDFNKVYHAVYNFCVVAMSNFYLDVTKIVCTAPTAQPARQPRPPCTRSLSLWIRSLPPSCASPVRRSGTSCPRPRV